MKGILFGFISFCFLCLASIPAIRLYPGKKYFKPLIGVFFLSSIFYSILFFSLPQDLNFLSSHWVIADPYLDFTNGLLILFLLFTSFWDTIYTSFLTGFSSGILVEFLRHQPLGLNDKELVEIYQRGQRGNPVVDGRLENLVRGGYVRLKEINQYELLPKGNFFASFTIFFQRLLHMGDGG